MSPALEFALNNVPPQLWGKMIDMGLSPAQVRNAMASAFPHWEPMGQSDEWLAALQELKDGKADQFIAAKMGYM